MEKRERLRALRAEAKNCRDPAAADDTLALLVALARLRGAENILEIGTAGSRQFFASARRARRRSLFSIRCGRCSS